jgi:HEAT repeat protein
MSGGSIARPARQLFGWQMIAILWFVAAESMVAAQPPEAEDPFNAAMADDSPTAEGSETPGQADDQQPKNGAAEPPEELDPMVRAILDLKASTPDQWIRSAKAMLDVGRPDLARTFLKQLLDAQPDPQQLVRLQQRFGSPLFLSFSSNGELQPEGASVADAVLTAADQARRDKTRLGELVAQLTAADASQRRGAIAALLRAGDVAVAPLVQVLADPGRTQEQAAVQQVLVTMGDEAVAPLLAGLDSTNIELRRHLIAILGKIGAKQAVATLLTPAFDQTAERPDRDAARQALEDILGGLPERAEAVDFLQQQLDRHWATAEALPYGDSDPVPVWTWNDEQRISELRLATAYDAVMQRIARTADGLASIAPSREDYRGMALATKLELSQRLVGLDQQLPANRVDYLVGDRSLDQLEQVLSIARKRQLPGAAIAAIGVLGQRGDDQILAGDMGQPSELTLGLLSPYRRVRHATAVAIMKLDPQMPYPGCSHLPRVLAYLAGSAGKHQVLVAHPRTRDSQTLAGLLSVAGFVTVTANTGQEAITAATASPDLVFAVISDRIERPQQTELLQLLRRDIRTAKLAVGLTYRALNQDRIQRVAERDPLTLAFPFPRSEPDVIRDASRLMALARPRVVPSTESIRQASFALDALARLAKEPDKYDFYNVMEWQAEVEEALTTRHLSTQAAQVLGLLGSPDAQQVLVDFASDLTRPLPARQAAAKAFGVAVKRHHLMLTRDQIMRQYLRYNQSEKSGVETQQVLASILDSIEASGGEPPAVPHED